MTSKVIGDVPVLSSVEDLSDVMENIADDMLQYVRGNFFVGGRPVGWQPLRKTGAPSHLIKTGRLLNSLIADSGDTWAEVRTGTRAEVPYIFLHQFGGMAGPKHKVRVDKRPYMVIDDNKMEQYKDQLRGFIMSTTKKEKQVV